VLTAGDDVVIGCGIVLAAFVIAGLARIVWLLLLIAAGIR
jgi:hypothetical protein